MKTLIFFLITIASFLVNACKRYEGTKEEEREEGITLGNCWSSKKVLLKISMYLLSSGHADFCSVQHKCSMGSGNCHDDNQCKSVKIIKFHKSFIV